MCVFFIYLCVDYPGNHSIQRQPTRVATLEKALVKEESTIIKGMADRTLHSEGRSARNVMHAAGLSSQTLTQKHGPRRPTTYREAAAPSEGWGAKGGRS